MLCMIRSINNRFTNILAVLHQLCPEKKSFEDINLSVSTCVRSTEELGLEQI